MRLPTIRRPAQWQAAIILAGTGLLAAACGSPASGSSRHAAASASAAAPSAGATAQSAARLCQDMGDLHMSVIALSHFSAGNMNVRQISTQLHRIKAELTAVASDEHGRFSGPASALENQVNSVQTAVKALRKDPASATAEHNAAAAFQSLTGMANGLLTAVKPSCPSGTASPGA